MTTGGKPGGLPPRRLGITSIFRWLDRLAFMISAWFFLAHRKKDFDVLHVHESHWLAGFGAWAGSRFGIPVVVKEAYMPVLFPLDAATPFLRRLDAWRRQPNFIAQTESAADHLREERVPADRIRTISNAVTIPATTATPADGMRVLCVGNLYQGAGHKGFDILLEAWKSVVTAFPEARLTIVGGGPVGAWRSRAAAWGVGDSVEFPGWADPLDAYHSRASLYVHPSRVEGMPNALMEAQAWGLPAVTTDIPGCRDVVERDVTGLIVAPGNADALGGAMSRLLGDPALRKRMGEAGRARMAARFSSSQATGKLDELYRFLCGSTT